MRFIRSAHDWEMDDIFNFFRLLDALNIGSARRRGCFGLTLGTRSLWSNLCIRLCLANHFIFSPCIQKRKVPLKFFLFFVGWLTMEKSQQRTIWEKVISSFWIRASCVQRMEKENYLLFHYEVGKSFTGWDFRLVLLRWCLGE